MKPTANRPREVKHQSSKSRSFWAGQIDLESLAIEQSVIPIKEFEQLMTDFLDPDESVETFNETVRDWRREGQTSVS